MKVMNIPNVYEQQDAQCSMAPRHIIFNKQIIQTSTVFLLHMELP